MGVVVSKTVSFSGGDYSSIRNWEIGERRQLAYTWKVRVTNRNGGLFSSGDQIIYPVSGYDGTILEDDGTYIRFANNYGNTDDVLVGQLFYESGIPGHNFEIADVIYQGEIAQADCKNNFPSGDVISSVSFDIFNWGDSTPDCYPEIIAKNNNRHTGKPGTGYTIKPSGVLTALFTFYRYERIIGIEFDSNSYNFSSSMFRHVNSANTKVTYFDSCIIRGIDQSATQTPAFSPGTSTTGQFQLTNCLVYDWGDICIDMRTSTNVSKIINCTFVGTDIAIQSGAPAPDLLVNSAAFLSLAAGAFRGTFDADSDYNRSEENDNTPGANSVKSASFEWRDSTILDWRPPILDSNLVNVGTDTRDAPYLISPVFAETSLTGQRRPTGLQFDIGAFEDETVILEQPTLSGCRDWLFTPDDGTDAIGRAYTDFFIEYVREGLIESEQVTGIILNEVWEWDENAPNLLWRHEKEERIQTLKSMIGKQGNIIIDADYLQVLDVWYDYLDIDNARCVSVEVNQGIESNNYVIYTIRFDFDDDFSQYVKDNRSIVWNTNRLVLDCRRFDLYRSSQSNQKLKEVFRSRPVLIKDDIGATFYTFRNCVISGHNGTIGTGTTTSIRDRMGDDPEDREEIEQAITELFDSVLQSLIAADLDGTLVIDGGTGITNTRFWSYEILEVTRRFEVVANLTFIHNYTVG